MEQRLQAEVIDAELLLEAETMGFTDDHILDLSGLYRSALQDLSLIHI